MAKKLNEQIVTSLPAPKKGNRIYYFAGAVLQGKSAPKGFGVRVTAKGNRSFIINYRFKGKEHRYTIGEFPDWKVLEAVKRARELRQLIDSGKNPLDDRTPPPETLTVAKVIDDFIEKYVRDDERPLRTAEAYASAFERLIKPEVGKYGIYELRRSHVAKMVDQIVKERGAVMADRARQHLRKALTWYAERDENFNLNQAIVRVAPRANAKERARDRVLSDDEIRSIWPVLGKAGTFGNLVKTLLLTAQRRDEVASMAGKEIGKDSIWTIPASRYKTKRPNHVPLSKDALAVIEAQKKAVAEALKKAAAKAKTEVPKCDYIFPSGERTPFSAFAKNKTALDQAVHETMEKAAKKGEKIEAIPNWRLHDLRRTARTLMARAGVPGNICERVLGHVIEGVEAVYDRHDYIAEKRDALEKLAGMIERILNPLPSTVTALDDHRARVQ